MSSYLKISNGSETKAYMLSSDDNNIEKPYLRVSGSVLPLTTRTTSGLGLKIQDSASEGSTHHITTIVDTTATYYTTSTVSDNISEASVVSITNTKLSISYCDTYSTYGYFGGTYYTLASTNNSVSIYDNMSLIQSNNSYITISGNPLYSTIFNTGTYIDTEGYSKTIRSSHSTSFSSYTNSCVGSLYSTYSSNYFNSSGYTYYPARTYSTLETYYSGKSSYTTKTTTTTLTTLLYRPLEYSKKDTVTTTETYSRTFFTPGNMSSIEEFYDTIHCYTRTGAFSSSTTRYNRSSKTVQESYLESVGLYTSANQGNGYGYTASIYGNVDQMYHVFFTTVIYSRTYSTNGSAGSTTTIYSRSYNESSFTVYRSSLSSTSRSYDTYFSGTYEYTRKFGYGFLSTTYLRLYRGISSYTTTTIADIWT